MTAAASTLKGWPAAERPRERLFDRGPVALADGELVAILLRTGVPGRTAVDVARDLLRVEGGSLRALAERAPAELAKRPGVGAAKAAAVLAAFELGRRMVAERDRPHARFQSSADVAAHFRPFYAGRKREVFQVVLLDAAHRLVRTRRITVGTLNLAVVHPRDVFREAVVERAAAVVLVHNHPAGDPAPSAEDVALTRQFVGAGAVLGIPVLDHVIVGGAAHFSFADSRRLAA